MNDLALRGSAPLYELASDYLDVLDLLEATDADAETLELEQKLDAIAGAITQKAENVAGLLTHLEGMAAMRRAEADRMRDLAQADQRKAGKLRAYLLRHMQAVGSERIDTTRFSLRVKTNPPSVHVLEEMLVPEEYVRTVTTSSVDKKAVLDNFKATGEIVPGIEVTRGVRLDIR